MGLCVPFQTTSMIHYNITSITGIYLCLKSRSIKIPLIVRTWNVLSESFRQGALTEPDSWAGSIDSRIVRYPNASQGEHCLANCLFRYHDSFFSCQIISVMPAIETHI